MSTADLIPIPPEVGHAGDGDIVQAMLRNLRERVAELEAENRELRKRLGE